MKYKTLFRFLHYVSLFLVGLTPDESLAESSCLLLVCPRTVTHLFSMHSTTLLGSVALLSTTGWAQYTLQQDYMADGAFFEQFNFWDAPDPTNGFVQYQNQDNAQDANLINTASGSIQMSVDTTQTISGGRRSVRIESKNTYSSGLFIIDASHMPVGCGTWPAFWMYGPDWPAGGEIGESKLFVSAQDATDHDQISSKASTTRMSMI